MASSERNVMINLGRMTAAVDVIDAARALLDCLTEDLEKQVGTAQVRNLRGAIAKLDKTRRQS